MSDSVRPHRRQSTRLCHPWDSPGKSTGVGCHFLLQGNEVEHHLNLVLLMLARRITSQYFSMVCEPESESESVSLLLCLTLWDPTDCSPPGSSVHGLVQARILEWAGIPFSRGSFQPGMEPRNTHPFFSINQEPQMPQPQTGGFWNTPHLALSFPGSWYRHFSLTTPSLN